MGSLSAVSRINHSSLSTREANLDKARNGRMFILIDDEDRENGAIWSCECKWRLPIAAAFRSHHPRPPLTAVLADRTLWLQASAGSIEGAARRLADCRNLDARLSSLS